MPGLLHTVMTQLHVPWARGPSHRRTHLLCQSRARREQLQRER